MKHRPWLALFVLSVGARAFAADPVPEVPPAAAPDAAVLDPMLSLVGRPRGLTADEAARRAAQSSPGVDAAAADVARAEGEMSTARAAWLPRLTFTARYTRLSPIDAPSLGPSGVSLVATPAGTGPLAPGDPLVGVPASALSFPVILDQYLLQANLVVPLVDYLLRVGRTVESAEAARAAAKLSREAALRDAAQRGRAAYYSWASARLEHAVLARAVDQSAEHHRVLEAARVEGRALGADVLMAEAQLARATLLREQAASREASAAATLGVVMHDEGASAYSIGEPLFEPLPDPPSLDADALERRALASRPEIAALAAARRALARRRDAARVQRYPRLDAFGNAYVSNPNARYVPQEETWHATWDLGLQLTWTPNEILTQDGVGDVFAAEERRILAEDRAVRDGIRQEIRRAVESVRQARAAAAAATRGEAAARAAYEQRRAAFEEGRATPAVLLDAETEHLRARLDVIGAAIQERFARAELRHVTGTEGSPSVR